jgi:uncharacterized protein with NRDE domain
VREGLPGEPAAHSRGTLVADFVRAAHDGERWLDALAPTAADYGRFQLLLWDGSRVLLAGNHPTFFRRQIGPGVHGLSNGPFDAPWPKVRRVRVALEQWIAQRDMPADPELAPLFAALADTRVAPDEQLPDTGIGLELERRLSPPFVRGSRYGTRCSSVVLVGRQAITFAERRFGPDAIELGESRQRIALR